MPPCAYCVAVSVGPPLLTVSTVSPRSEAVQRGGQSGHPAADDHEVGALASQDTPPGRAAHSPPPGLPISIMRCTDSRARAAVSGST